MILMERAGQALADAVSVAMHSEGTDEVLFVCGGGNNGGDGFVAARILLERGEEVAVLCLAERFSEDCEAVRAKYGGEVLTELPRRRYRMIVDCLFGTGMTRPAEGCYRKLIEYINNSDAYVIACDLPSGLLEGGIASDPCVEANETVTMGQCKQALLLADGAFRAVFVHLKVDQLIHAIPQANHAFDTLCGGGVQLRFHHTAVFTVVHFAVHHGIGVVFHIGVSGDGGVDFFTFAQLRQLRFLILAAYVFHGIVKLVSKFQPLNGSNGKILSAILGAFGGLSA